MAHKPNAQYKVGGMRDCIGRVESLRLFGIPNNPIVTINRRPTATASAW